MAYENTKIQKVKITKTFSDFATAGLTNDITLFVLPEKGFIHQVQIEPATTFSGGTISAYTISVGITGSLNKYMTARDVFTGAGVPGYGQGRGVESFSGTTDIKIAAVAEGDNLDQASQGVVNIWIYYSILS